MNDAKSDLNKAQSNMDPLKKQIENCKLMCQKYEKSTYNAVIFFFFFICYKLF